MFTGARLNPPELGGAGADRLAADQVVVGRSTTGGPACGTGLRPPAEMVPVLGARLPPAGVPDHTEVVLLPAWALTGTLVPGRVGAPCPNPVPLGVRVVEDATVVRSGLDQVEVGTPRVCPCGSGFRAAAEVADPTAAGPAPGAELLPPGLRVGVVRCATVAGPVELEPPLPPGVRLPA